MVEPVIVISPFCRDARTRRVQQPDAERIVDMLPGYKVILGKNHLRGELPTDHRPEAFEYGGKDLNRVINLIDKVGIRFTWHLLKRCSAFSAGHSSIILMAWEHNKPNVCAMSDFITIDGPNGLDRKYLHGRGRTNTFMPVFKSEDFKSSARSLLRGGAHKGTPGRLGKKMQFLLDKTYHFLAVTWDEGWDFVQPTVLLSPIIRCREDGAKNGFSY